MKRFFSLLVFATLLFAGCGDDIEDDGYDDPLEPSGVDMEEDKEENDTSTYYEQQ